MFKQLFSSSQDPEQLSLTIKGLLTTLVPVAGMVITFTGHQVDNQSLQQIVDAAGIVVTSVGAVISSIMMLWGLIRKFLPAKV